MNISYRKTLRYAMEALPILPCFFDFFSGYSREEAGILRGQTKGGEKK